MNQQQQDRDAEKLRNTPREELDEIERKLLADHEQARVAIMAIDQRTSQLDSERARLVDQRQYNVGVADYTIGLALEHNRKRKLNEKKPPQPIDNAPAPNQQPQTS